MKLIDAPLSEYREIEELRKKLSGKDPKGFYQLSGCVDAAKAHLFHLMGEEKPKLVLTYSDRKARELYEDLLFFEENTYLYPAKDLLFYQAALHGNLEAEKRMLALKALYEKEDVCIVTTFSALFSCVSSPETFAGKIRTLRTGEKEDLSDLIAMLTDLGYYRCDEIASPGDFAVRGGILDLFSFTAEQPFRIEFFGDEIDSIRLFDVYTQRSVETLEEAVVYPAGNLPEEETASFLDFFDERKAVIFLDEPERTLEHGRMTETEFAESMKNRLLDHEEVYEEKFRLLTYEETVSKLSRYPLIGLSALDNRVKEWKSVFHETLEIRSLMAYHNSFELLTRDLSNYRKKGYRILLLSASKTHARNLPGDLSDNGVTAFYTEDTERELLPGEVAVMHGSLSRSFEYPMVRFLVISWNDFTGAVKKKRKLKPRYEGEKIHSFTELTPGDYVVHEMNGVGIYRGIEQVEVEKTIRDYIKIEYADHGNLYILATQLNLIQKYAGKDAEGKPRLNRLGGKEWGRTKERVQKAVREIAGELVQLYRARQEKEGHVFSEDTVWQKEFEELFPFEETEDQIRAIEDTKRDMESKKIMDRLICGDVGYGKTEVALRAAFKAVSEGMQVSVLVPTTILAQQHYHTFTNRMKDYPIRIDLLSRFRSPSEQKKTLAELKKGQVDIIIGTHRLLSKDVAYKNLGLLVVDEEQRFGVTHKEKIKQMKNEVDVLTLTATPIPRTLHMSLIGIRDMSVLSEPPQDRLPIQTYIMEYSPEMVREAISREISRNGQVYYVFNRIDQIAGQAEKLRQLLPEAEIAYAHGRMKETELEDIMYRFINGDIDVLVSTTIIETGLDIPNVNTMIIADADHYGLSQLYQLRGRIGRSSRTAYAFLMYQRDKLLSEVAEKRLAAIREFTDLGSGFKIAMRDLEIRGAGNLLGAEQHGHMEAVGYDLYCKLLSEAVKEEKGELPKEHFDTTIDISVDSFIPASYIPNELQKMDIYKRIAGIETREEAEEMTDELIDRFSDPPKSVENLIRIALIRGLAHDAFFTKISEQGEEIRFQFYEKAGIDPAALPKFLELYDGALSLRMDQKPPWLCYAPTNSRNRITDKLSFLEEFLKNAREMLINKDNLA